MSLNRPGADLLPYRKGNNTVITIRDVAKESGFSASTVSIVLNNAPLSRYIPPQTKSRIEKAAKRLGYHPNIFARSLRSKRTHAVGVMVFDITDPYCTLILRGIENSLYQASYLPMLTDVHNERGRFERYLEMLLERRIEGLIVIANWLFVDINLLADLGKREVPTVIIGRQLQPKNVSSVIVDTEAGGHAALEHLYNLGHRNIAVIRGPRKMTDSKVRWKGITAFAKENNFHIDPKLTVELPELLDANSGFEGGHRMTEELLKRKHPFTALMAFDDVTAFGAIRALTKAGLRVPDDCSVMGFDDVPAASLLFPSLTTVRQPMEAMGSSAVSILVDEMNAAMENRDFSAVYRTLAPQLIVRESTKALH